MATLDDKLLGEKLHYYCSSSEDEAEEEGSNDEEDVTDDVQEPVPSTESRPPGNVWQGSSTNTGPKGVIGDWQRYKQLETERRAEHLAERHRLAQRLAHACPTSAEEDLQRQTERQLEEEVGQLMEDESILREFIQKRMQELANHAGGILPRFGKVVSLESADEFLNAVDKEEKTVTVVVHMYSERVASCQLMNDALHYLSTEYQLVKFCTLRADAAGLSRQFTRSGLPALVVYKGGAVIGNFVRLEDDLCTDFCPHDVENFLIEHGLLEDKSCTPSSVRASIIGH